MYKVSETDNVEFFHFLEALEDCKWRYNIFQRKIWYISKRNMELFEDCVQPCHWKVLRANVSMHQKQLQVTQNLLSPLLLYFVVIIILILIIIIIICLDNCGVVFLWKYILVFEKWFFSFDRSNMQIFTVNIIRVVWPRVTNVLDLRYFCQHNPSFYHLNLIPFHYWS